MTDAQQINALLTIMQPAFQGILLIAIAAIAAIVWDDWKQTRY